MVIIAIVLAVLLLLTTAFYVIGKRQIKQLNESTRHWYAEELKQIKSNKSIHEEIAESLAERKVLVEMFNDMMEAEEKVIKPKKSKK